MSRPPGAAKEWNNKSMLFTYRHEINESLIVVDMIACNPREKPFSLYTCR